MKFSTNRKATSSAALVSILIIGTLVFSIAAAVSTGSLTFTSIAYEHLSLTDFTWASNNAYCQIMVENTGTSDLSILTVRINGIAPKTINPPLLTPYALEQGSSVVFTLTSSDSFVRGSLYEFTVVTTKGNSFSCSVKAM